MFQTSYEWDINGWPNTLRSIRELYLEPLCYVPSLNMCNDFLYKLLEVISYSNTLLNKTPIPLRYIFVLFTNCYD